MKPRFFDIHTHLQFEAFKDDKKEVAQRALDDGVWMIQVGTQKDTSLKAIELAENFNDGVYATVGLHPIHTDKSFHDKKELGPSFAKATEGKGGFLSRGEEFDYEYYKKLAKNEKVVAIGECGLDYFRLSEDSKIKQKDVFVSQIEFANEIGKPLMLHVRNALHRNGSEASAYSDAFDILKATAKVKGNMHFFAGGWEEAKKFLDIGFTLSFTGVITFTHDYDEVIKNSPLDMIMSETDAPYVAPTLHRGKRNEPAYVQDVVKRIVEIRLSSQGKEDYEKVQEALVANAMRVFNIQ